MANIDHDLHPTTLESLQAPRNPRTGNAFGISAFVDAPAESAQAGNGARGIAQLYGRLQRRHRQRHREPHFTPAPSAGIDRFREEIAADPPRLRTDRIRMPQYAGRRIVVAKHLVSPR